VIKGTRTLCALCALDDAACDAAGGWTSKVAQDLSELDALSRVWEGGGRGGQFLQLAPETDAPSASTADADHHFFYPYHLVLAPDVPTGPDPFVREHEQELEQAVLDALPAGFFDEVSDGPP